MRCKVPKVAGKVGDIGELWFYELDIAGMVMLSIVHTFPPSLELKPEYVAPAAEAIVLPKVVSAEARVIFVLRYFCSATVPVQPPSHSVPVPYLLDQHYSREFGNKNSPSHIRPRLVREGRENLARLRIGHIPVLISHYPYLHCVIHTAPRSPDHPTKYTRCEPDPSRSLGWRPHPTVQSCRTD